MSIYLIVAPNTHLHPLTKEPSNKHRTAILPEEISGSIDCVVIDLHLSEHHLDLLQAQRSGLRLLSPTEFLYEYSKDKARVVIADGQGRQEASARVLHTIVFYSKPLSYCLQRFVVGQQTHLADAESVFIETDTQGTISRPTVAPITDIIPTDNPIAYDTFISAIVKGGVLIYNEEDTTPSNIVETNESPIRRMEYHTPAFGTHNGETYLTTLEGELLLGELGTTSVSSIEAARWVYQNMTIDEADFHGAMADYHS